MDIDSSIDEVIQAIRNGRRRELTMYDELAPIYDYLYGEEYDYVSQSKYIQAAVENIEHPVVVEGGCGTGRLLEQLSKDLPDSQIKGIELNEGMAKLAKERTQSCENVSVIQRDMFEVNQSCGVFALFGVMAHVSRSERKNFFEKVYNNIDGNGAIIAEYKHPDYEVDGRYSPWESETVNYEVKSHFITLYEDEKSYYAVSYEFIDKHTDEKFSTGELMEINFHHPDELKRELQEAGFENISLKGEIESNGVIIAEKHV